MSNTKKPVSSPQHSENEKNPDNQDNLEQGLSRRGFLRAAAAVTGGAALAAGGNMTARAAQMDHSTMQHAMHGAQHGHDMNKYGSMMFMEGHSMKPGQVIEPPGSPSDDEVEYKVFDVDVRIIEHEILPGIKAHMFAFNGQVPGPEFHVTEGDWVKVNFTNHTEEMHTIHWHGVVVPYTMDGVPMVTQDPVHPGASQTFRHPLVSLPLEYPSACGVGDARRFYYSPQGRTA
jgi:FtsP/CotA-like multicopper oxidase with cupredoxin domain